MYYRGSEGVVVVFDLSNAESFKGLSYWIEDLSKSEFLETSNFYLIGTKADLERKVSLDVITDFAAQHNMKYFEVSARTG